MRTFSALRRPVLQLIRSGNAARLATPALGYMSTVVRTLSTDAIVESNPCKSAETFFNNSIVTKRHLSPTIVEMVVKAPDIARHCEAGHFVVVLSSESAERVPLTIADYDREAQTITLVIQEVGVSSKKICDMPEGEVFPALLGPLGLSTEIEKYGKVAIVGGGVGIAPVHPIAKSLKEAGNEVTSIIGARNKDVLFWEDEMREASDKLIVCTDDGSYATPGMVTEPLKNLIDNGEKFDHIWAVGPLIMMKSVANLTKEYGIPTTVSLNSIMVDGTGMCGGCRVEIGNETKFTCVDGPEFDGHQVDWDNMAARLRAYTPQEHDATDILEEPEVTIDPADDRTPMPEQDPMERVKNFDEVALGYTAEMAREDPSVASSAMSQSARWGAPSASISQASSNSSERGNTLRRGRK